MSYNALNFLLSRRFFLHLTRTSTYLLYHHISMILLEWNRGKTHKAWNRYMLMVEECQNFLCGICIYYTCMQGFIIATNNPIIALWELISDKLKFRWIVVANSFILFPLFVLFIMEIYFRFQYYDNNFNIQFKESLTVIDHHRFFSLSCFCK